MLAAPDTAQLSVGDRKRLAPLLEIREALASPGVEPSLDPEERRRLDFRWMRRQLVLLCDARICLGGKLAQRNHRTHGVVEEVAFALRQARPVYLCGMLKGSTALLIDLLSGRTTAADARERISHQPDVHGKTPCHPATHAHLAYIEQLGGKWCADLAGLKFEEQRALFEAQSIDMILATVVPALVRLRTGGRATSAEVRAEAPDGKLDEPPALPFGASAS